MMNQDSSDPFASYRISQKQQVAPSPREEITENQEDPFSAYRIKKAQELPDTYEIGRHATRIGSRMAEIIGGIPGDIENLVKSGLVWPIKKLVSPETFQKIEEGGVFKRRLPTSKELQEFSEEKSKGFTKAQTPAEEMGDEVAKTVGSLLGPMKFRRALGIGVGSQLAKEGIKIAGLGEGAQEAGKLGTMFLMSLYNPKGALKYASEQYKIADSLVHGTSIYPKVLEHQTHALLSDLKKGITTPAKNTVIKSAEDLLGKFNNGKIKVQDLTAAKRDINTLMGDPALLKRERNLLKVVAKDVDVALKDYGKTNLAFARAYQPANEIYGAVMQGNKTSNYILKTLGPKSILVAAAEGALGHPEAILPTLAGTAGLYATARAGEFFTRMIRSQELQKFYAKALAAAVAEDAGALRLYENKIEKYLEENKK